MFSTTPAMASATMTMKSFIPVASCDFYPPVYESGEAKFRSVRMKWIVATDRNGTRWPQMRWWSN